MEGRVRDEVWNTYYIMNKILLTHLQCIFIVIYLRGSVGLSAVAPGRQGATLSQTLGRITGHWLLLLLVGGVVVVVTAVSLVVHHLTLVVSHVAEGRVLHRGGISQSSAVKRRVALWTEGLLSCAVMWPLNTGVRVMLKGDETVCLFVFERGSVMKN